MIVPMKKVSLIILSEQKKSALKTLRRLGCVHIEITEGSGERLAALKEQISLLEDSIFTVGSSASKGTPQKEAGVSEALTLAKKVSELTEQTKKLQMQAATLKSELDRTESWGNLNPDELDALAKKGIAITLYEMPVSEYAKADISAKTVVLGKTKSSVRFALFSSDETDGTQEHLKNYVFKLPEMSCEKMRQTVSELEERISAIKAEIVGCAEYKQSMKNAIAALNKDIELETYETGMANEDLTPDAENKVSVAYFKSYIEAENLDKLKNVARENSWGLVIQEPTQDDDVPTKLKNNKLVSLVYPLTDFLGTVPGYFEYDISAWFLGFILIFFGIIFGDGGYGLIVCAAAAIPIIKSLVSKKPVSPTFLLIGLFGVSTVIWGTLTCTWFGLTPEQLPMWLRSISLPIISNVNANRIWYPFWTDGAAGLTTAQNLQIVCFSLALVQLTVAHIKSAVRNRKSVKILGDIGSVLQLLGMYYVVLSLVVNAEVFKLGLVISGVPVGLVAIALVGVGFLMSFVFANYEGSVVKSILCSLKNIVSVLLGVVNVFSDIVSYIRLWAVGLAGAAISATVNQLASPLLGNFMFMILAIFLLVFGHGLNMILNVLSVIVHGIRLNTLEFSSHLDMSWSGHKFKPFEE